MTIISHFLVQDRDALLRLGQLIIPRLPLRQVGLESRRFLLLPGQLRHSVLKELLGLG